MIDEPLLVWLLRFTGAGMLGLALVHHPIARRLGWKEDVKRLRPVNEGIFHSHLFFICLGLVLLGLALAFGAAAFVERTVLGRWIAGMLFVFWLLRLYRQWFGFPQSLWRGKTFETGIHYVFTSVWVAVVFVFATLFVWQMGWIG